MLSHVESGPWFAVSLSCACNPLCAAQPLAAGLQRYGRTAFGPGAKAKIRSAEEAQAALFARLALEYVSLFELVESPKHRDAFFQLTTFPDLLSQAIYSVRPPSALRNACMACLSLQNLVAESS